MEIISKGYLSLYNFNFWDRQPVTEWHGGWVQVHPRAENVLHLMRGEVFEIEGEKYLAFGGAVSHDKYHRTLNVDMWEQEQATVEDIRNAKQNLDRHGYEVDYILSHTPPMHIMDMIPYIDPELDRGAVFLSWLSSMCSYKLILSGHIHEDMVIPEERFIALYNTVNSIKELKERICPDNSGK
ncbi:MAG: hypothetical protein IJZ72_08990 [Oscillospiraceae bacterium]|nr:hypothetical protein [Oscillospiraceae bacterium]